jgi:RNA polymerase sigma-70 factor (ECF subfamily)
MSPGRETTAQADPPASDAELAAAFRRDPQLFTAVYDRYAADIHGYVAGRLDRAAAEDVTAEAFCVAFDQRHRFEPERGALRPWLFGIATNLVARHRRREARYYAALARVGSDPAVDSHEGRVVTSVAAQRLQPQLARALAALSPGERDVLLLVALGQLSHQEVAEALDISYGTVGSRLSRARAKVHGAFNQEDLDG